LHRAGRAPYVRTPAWLRVQRYLMGAVLGGLALRIALERSSTVA
jgi:threonine/homoserine/homoserine lactone efflux protein